MAKYKIYEHGTLGLTYSSGGFAVFALVIPWWWAIVNRLWRLAFWGGFVTILGALFDVPGFFAAYAICGIFAGVFGNPLRDRDLRKRGYEPRAIVEARTPADALRLYREDPGRFPALSYPKIEDGRSPQVSDG